MERTIRDIHISVDKAQGKMKRSYQKMEEDIDPARIKLKQTNQKLRGEKITKSGISKGKDIKKWEWVIKKEKTLRKKVILEC